MFVAALGLFSSVAAYLAGRAPRQIKAYRQIISDLRAEVERVTANLERVQAKLDKALAEVDELRAVIRRLTSRLKSARFARNIQRPSGLRSNPA